MVSRPTSPHLITLCNVHVSTEDEQLCQSFEFPLPTPTVSASPEIFCQSGLRASCCLVFQLTGNFTTPGVSGSSAPTSTGAVGQDVGNGTSLASTASPTGSASLTSLTPSTPPLSTQTASTGIIIPTQGISPAGPTTGSGTNRNSERRASAPRQWLAAAVSGFFVVSLCLW
jgi:hypothetical protein